MAAVVLACKAAVAVLLTAAGGAKLADLPGFAASVRLFWAGRPCRCFGSLSGRNFSAAGIARAVIIAACAAVAVAPVRPGLTQLGAAGRLGLLAGALLVAAAAYSAAAAVGAGQARDSRREGRSARWA